MASVFTRIVNGEIPSYKIAESSECYAFSGYQSAWQKVTRW